MDAFVVLVLSSVALLLGAASSLPITSKPGGGGGGGLPNPIHPLRTLHGSGRDNHLSVVSCGSWRLAVETNNLRNWSMVPAECERYIGHYMLGQIYRDDFRTVAEAAAEHVAGVALPCNSIWVFDIDETVLSNLPYYAEHGFRAEPYNSTQFNAWVNTGKAPALPESLKLYQKLVSMGIKIAFLTGRRETSLEITAKNLKNAGYQSWEKLILRPSKDTRTAMAYKTEKRSELVGEGYKIVGNMGDQWSDLLGAFSGLRTFKVPDPMYYIN